MDKLSKKITRTNLSPFITIKLRKLNFTKLGHLVMSSYPELFYTHLFTNSELNEIQNSLNREGLDFIFEMNLDKIPYLRREVVRFNFNEYQTSLYESHLKEYDETKIEPLMYSDPLYIVKYFFQIYRQLYPEEVSCFEADKQLALNIFLKDHPGMTIADFVDIKPYPIDVDIIKTISTLLDLPLNDDLPYSEMINRENQIFNRENVHTNIIQAYEYIAHLNDEAMDKYLKDEKSKQYTKKLTN